MLSRLDESLEERAIVSLRDRVAAATTELDEALAQATRTLGPLSFKLQRTRHRGVYRSGRKYVVPFVDTVGIDRRKEFSTRAEACAFREAIRDQGETPPEFREGDFQEETWGGVSGEEWEPEPERQAATALNNRWRSTPRGEELQAFYKRATLETKVAIGERNVDCAGSPGSVLKKGITLL